MNVSTTMSQPAIIEAFVELRDSRRRAGQRYTLPLYLDLFTLAIAA
ncbi:hypothetical protein I8748_21120 [Nostoc sp. CENA67]|uniref:Uncharacterized protein n=1 Tax=Amazonocrinis nigriterrae CENA67 TaxID=2794033 RepID=A0A8J7LA19_9NOST|nr:hypothetical protein [Amazonocrinis nigriterrae]MBH8564655.1 hypothetical protein [Amazonocrinis nigriterrae CENA67]